jgi:dinuclear metal center YbgI/SA1388 family protein
VVDVLGTAYPPGTAQSWDAVGLVCGDPDAPVRRVLLAVDPVSAVVEEAVEAGADLLVVHHPLLLRGVHSVAADTPKGRVVHRLLTSGVALHVAHTNADAAVGGVNEALADLLGLVDLRPLEPAPAVDDLLLVTYVPAAAVDRVVDAAAAAGAGRIGGYDRCAFTSGGTGTFDAGEGTAPAVGRAGRRERVEEVRVEMVVPARTADAVRARVVAAHPYEEVPVHLLPRTGAAPSTGIGRVGRLPEPLDLAAFARLVAERLPATAQGVRVSGDPGCTVETVALCGGSGDSLFGAVRASGADVYLTADLRHHPASEAREHRADGRPYLVDVAHWASEWPWLGRCADLLRARVPGVEVQVSTLATDPWTFVVPGSTATRSGARGSAT